MLWCYKYGFMGNRHTNALKVYTLPILAGSSFVYDYKSGGNGFGKAFPQRALQDLAHIRLPDICHEITRG